MRRNIRIVLDTNLFVSMFLGSRSLRPIFAALTTRTLTLLISEFILKELYRVLSNPKLADVPKGEITKFLDTIRKNAVVVKLGTVKRICRDPSDDPVIATALSAAADFLVTGDRDILVLSRIEKTRFIRPAEFIRVLSGKNR